jgi:hypothetical protein
LKIEIIDKYIQCRRGVLTRGYWISHWTEQGFAENYETRVILGDVLLKDILEVLKALIS